MIGQRQELIPMPEVPIDDHLGVVVAVAPERVGVQITLEPPGLRIGNDEIALVLGMGVRDRGGCQHNQEDKAQILSHA